MTNSIKKSPTLCQKDKGGWKFLSSLKLAIWLLVVIAAASLAGTLGLSRIYSSWWFILLLAIFSLNLTACLLNRLFARGASLGAFLCHLGVLLVLLGALVGWLCGQRGYIEINEGSQIDSFASGDKVVDLGFSLRLNDFIYSENIDPEEKLLVYSAVQEDFCRLKDPSPDDPSPGLIAEIPTDTGVEHNIADTGYKVKILRYLPDFVLDIATKKASSRSFKANNPAIEVELKGKDEATEAFWVFARYPDMHQRASANFHFIYHWVNRRPKDFVSDVSIIQQGREILRKDIRVNFPLEFGGYTFFQSSYDTQQLNWSGLRVVRDPGVGIVYLGFGLLILGLSLRFYLGPLLAALKR